MKGVADRRTKTFRDMALSMGLIAVVALVLYGMYGMISFSPGGAADGQTPTADVTGGFTRAQPLVGFPVVIPVDLPATWTPNSFSFTDRSAASTEKPAAVRGGWLTEQGRFITVIESNGAVGDVLNAELGAAGSATGSEIVGTPSGTVEWTVTTGRRGEAAWFRTAGDVTYLITGSASPADFTTLARAVSTAA
jgi:hypothetical protein